jgi:poly(A) polymerase
VQSLDLIGQLVRAFADRQLFLVGGSIRDELLERETSDLDFATDAPPEETRRRVAPWVDSVWLVGETFGTVGLQQGETKAETMMASHGSPRSRSATASRRISRGATLP